MLFMMNFAMILFSFHFLLRNLNIKRKVGCWYNFILFQIDSIDWILIDAFFEWKKMKNLGFGG